MLAEGIGGDGGQPLVGNLCGEGCLPRINGFLDDPIENVIVIFSPVSGIVLVVR